jgi:hypothetical protein
LGVTFIVGVGAKLTVTIEVAVPQALAAVTITEPELEPMFIVIELVLAGLDVMFAPGGTVHV